MFFKHISLCIMLTSILGRTLNPRKILSTIERLKTLKWDSTTNIIFNKSNKKYTNDNIELLLDENEQFQNKTLITLTPGGLRGFYNLGTCVYIKENFNTTNMIFSGASAGAWNGLTMTYKNNPHTFATQLLQSLKEMQLKSIYDTQIYLKKEILKNYDTDDFNLDKLFIAVQCIDNEYIFTNIYTDFDDLEDALNCCIASSNIPFITGIWESTYKNKFSLDGGFSIDPFLDLNSSLEISPDMWNKDNSKKSKQENFYKMFFYNNNINYHKLYIDGYNDARLNNDSIYASLNDKF